MSPKVKKIFWLILCFNLSLAIVRFFFASLTDSLSLFSDGLHSLMDGASNTLSLIAIKIADKPPDEDHPYGHRKFETLGAMGISGFLCLAAWEIITSAWQRILHPVRLPHSNPWIIGCLGTMIVATFAVTTYEYYWGRKLQNTLLLADAKHTRSDALASILALLSLITAAFHLYWVDTVAALLIVLLILWAAYRIIKDSVLTLSDARRLNPEPIRALVEKIKGIQNCHMIRSHGLAHAVHVDLHIVISPTMSAQEAFEIENEVTQNLKRVYPEISEVTVRHQTHMPAKF